MYVKPRVKIVFFSLLIIAIITTGIIMFQKLSYNKGVFETDLYTHIPAEVTGILQINKEKGTKVFTPFFPELQQVLQTIEKYLTYPILLTEQKQEIYIISKITGEQEAEIKRLLGTTLFPSFSPKVRKYKDAQIFFYPTDNNSFFSCMFYKGFFAGGYNYILLENFVDTNSANNIFSEQSAVDIAKKMKTSYPANLYFNNNTFFTSFNIDLDANFIDLEGTTSKSLLSNGLTDSESDNDSIIIDYSIFPDSLISYQIDLHPTAISSSINCLFESPSYAFILNDKQASPLYALKYKDDRFDVYNYLNKLEVNYIQKRFSTADVVLGTQHIYRTSEQMGSEIFHHNSSVYLTFYKSHLLICADRNILIEYLKKNGNYVSNSLFDPVNISAQTISLFFSSDIQKYYPEYLPNYYLIRRMGKTQACFKTYIENDEKKIEILLNN